MEEYARETFALGQDQVERLEAEIRLLREEIRRSNRNRWLRLLVGSMVSMVLDKVVSSDVAQRLFEFIVQGWAAALSYRVARLS